MINLVKLRKRAISLILLLAVFSTNYSSYSQTNNVLIPKINIPTSPEAALLGRFGDIPIGYYTGTANISIPLYIIKEGGSEIPITLSYHSSGIKVEDQATWVGLGWDLLPGGAIIQEVRGIRDAFDNNLNCTPTEYSNFKTRINNAGSIGNYKVVNQMGRAFYDFTTRCPIICSNGACVTSSEAPAPEPPNSEPSTLVGSLLLGNGDPDIYHYNFGGYSGKYYINPETHQVTLIDKNVEIFFEMNGESSIKATTLDGTQYLFSIIESAYEDGYMNPLLSKKSGRTYKLSSIQFLNGKSVNFSYVDTQLSGNGYTQKITLATSGFAPVGSTQNGPPQLILTKSSSKTLTRITTSDAIIDFNLETREDINLFSTDNAKRLKSIDITSIQTNKKVKSFVFGYSYFPYSLVGVITNTFTTAQIDALGKRLKLDSVKEIGYDENQIAITTKPAHQFEYDMTNTMPINTSFAKDFWGYYNGEPNQQLLPDLGYFDYPNTYLLQTNNTPFTYNYVGANRYTDNSKAGAYMLNKISYPTGGYSEFVYEPNSFSNQFIPDHTSNVFKNYSIEDNCISTNNANKQFKISKTTTIHFENRINNGAANYNNLPPLTRDQMLGCYIKLYKFTFVNGVPQTTLIQQWNLSTVLNVDFDRDGGKVWSEDVIVTFDPDPNPYFSYHVEVNFPDNLNNPLFASTAGVSSHFTFYDDTDVDISESKQCGMRIKSIKNYTSTGSLANNKSYQYFEGKLLNHFAPINLRYISAFNCAGGGAPGFCNCPTTQSNPGLVAELSISPDFVKESGNMIGYGRVEETDLAINDLDNTGKKSFEFLNFENLSSSMFPVVVNLKNGLPAKEIIYNKSGDKVYEKIYNFHDLYSTINCYYGLQIIQNFIGNFDPNEAGLGTPGSRSKFSYYATPIISEWNKLQNTITTQYLNGNALTTNESYVYNSQGNLSTLTTVNSKNESLLTKYYYPIDGMINSYVDNYMTTVHNTGTPVILEQYNGSQLLTRQKTVFDNVPNSPTLMPHYIYLQKGIAPEEKRITIDSYDDKGNITQYRQENNIPVSFVWNPDKTLPIAKIENATYASLLALPSGLNSDFRTSLPNAMVTTYTYKPLVGVSTVTDPNGLTTYYEYDSFGRLKLVKDKDGKILKTYNYHYKN